MEEQMNMQKGKITITNLIFFCIVVFAGFMAFKYIANGIEKKQIKKEVFDGIGVFRGSHLTDAKIKEIIGEVLGKRALEPLEVYDEFKSNGMVYFYYKYEITVNYLLFKRKEIIEVEEDMENYGG
jgi:hypothetical protein